MDKEILKQLNQLSYRIRMLSRVQMVLVEHMNKLSKEFNTDFIASTLAEKEIREGFTKWLNTEAADLFGDSSHLDEAKLMMIEINEGIDNIRKDK